MKLKFPDFLKSYGFSLLLILSVLLGSVLGIVLKKDAAILKPLGDIFLNLLFTAIVPLVFFSISSAVAGMSNRKRLGRIMSSMLFVFMVTGITASAIMILAVQLYPPAVGVTIDLNTKVQIDHFKTSEQIVKAFAVPDFSDLLSKRNMLALIVFSTLVGMATAAIGNKGSLFAAFLTSANEVMIKVITYIMYYAPIGLCAYFANFIGVYGSDLLGTYFRAMVLYYPAAILYIIAVISVYAYIAGRGTGIRTFWKNIAPPALTALATGSSVAAIPANLEAADNIGIPRDISEVVIPVGTTIHKDGSCMGAVVKIAFLFGIFHLDFSGPAAMLAAIGIALLAGTVIAGIPSGGVIGEILIISLYGFPLEAFPIISMIGALIDPPATMVNSMSDNVASMLVSRMVNGRGWMK
ncbi:MAG: dicarboxylate/amino acid:cation symporter [Syntrophales bacterium]|nr:dicarboxylate/amino acid:cation symporter [Syntrophales bacterium]